MLHNSSIINTVYINFKNYYTATVANGDSGSIRLWFVSELGLGLRLGMGLRTGPETEAETEAETEQWDRGERVMNA